MYEADSIIHCEAIKEQQMNKISLATGKLKILRISIMENGRQDLSTFKTRGGVATGVAILTDL